MATTTKQVNVFIGAIGIALTLAVSSGAAEAQAHKPPRSPDTWPNSIVYQASRLKTNCME